MKLKFASLLSLLLCLTLFSSNAQALPRLDNSDLTPKFVPDSEVKMEGNNPDWLKTLIMAEVRLETATPQGTLKSGVAVLDHYAEMGVNGLWITPIYGRNGLRSIGYGNRGPQTIQANLSGSEDYQESIAAVRAFVEEAHRRNIRILFDIVVWGTGSDSPLVAAHPEFYKRDKGKLQSMNGGYAWNWSSPGLRRWFKATAVRFIEETNGDGFRVDLAPDISGSYFKEIREALYARGRKVVIMSEMPNKDRSSFDFEENGVTGWTESNDFSNGYTSYLKQFRKFGAHNTYFFHHDIVDAIRTGEGIGHADLQRAGRGGTFRFYISNELNHDDYKPFAMGNPVRFAYSTIFAPYIPLWWIGEEWHNPDGRQPPTEAQKKDPGSYVMYTNPINWNWNPNQVAFYETIKQYIRIRREYPAIFNHFALIGRNANIARVDARKIGANQKLTAYARFGAGRAILIVPNYASNPQLRSFNISASFAELRLNPNEKYVVQDLNSQFGESGTVEEIAVTPSEQARGLVAFRAEIKPNHLGLYAVVPASRQVQ